MKRILVVLLICLFATAAFAVGPDKLTFTNFSSLPASTINGENHQFGNVNPGDTLTFNFTLISNGTGSGSTVYPDNISVTATTIVPLSGNVSVTGLTNCNLVLSTPCNESATITAPQTPGAYQVKIQTTDGRNGTGQITTGFRILNFTVVAASCTPAATSITFETPVCTLYKANSTPLSATLTSGGLGVSGKALTFILDGVEVGSATTESNGVATLAYDPSALAVGDHLVSAEWTSDDACSYLSPTSSGATLGIQYLYLGFQQPINADGSSIFNGKSLPVKIKIADANGAPVTDANAFVFTRPLTPAVVGTTAENVAASINFDHGNVMRYDSTANQYVYNWDLSTVPNGTNTVRVFLNEGTCAPAHEAIISVGKKK